MPTHLCRAGKYVIHFGESPAAAAEHTANTIAAAHPDKPRPQITGLAKARNELAVIPTSTGDQLVGRSGYAPGCRRITAMPTPVPAVPKQQSLQHPNGGVR